MRLNEEASMSERLASADVDSDAAPSFAFKITLIGDDFNMALWPLKLEGDCRVLISISPSMRLFFVLWCCCSLPDVSKEDVNRADFERVGDVMVDCLFRRGPLDRIGETEGIGGMRDGVGG